MNQSNASECNDSQPVMLVDALWRAFKSLCCYTYEKQAHNSNFLLQLGTAAPRQNAPVTTKTTSDSISWFCWKQISSLPSNSKAKISGEEKWVSWAHQGCSHTSEKELRCFIVWVLLCFTGTRTCKKINKKHFRPSAMDLIKYDVIWFYISWHVKNKPFSLVTNLPTFSQSKASINSNHKNTVRTVIRSLHAMCVFWKFSI